MLLHGLGNVRAEHWYDLKLTKLEGILRKKWKKWEEQLKVQLLLNLH